MNNVFNSKFFHKKAMKTSKNIREKCMNKIKRKVNNPKFEISETMFPFVFSWYQMKWALF